MVYRSYATTRRKAVTLHNGKRFVGWALASIVTGYLVSNTLNI